MVYSLHTEVTLNLQPHLRPRTPFLYLPRLSIITLCVLAEHSAFLVLLVESKTSIVIRARTPTSRMQLYHRPRSFACQLSSKDDATKHLPNTRGATLMRCCFGRSRTSHCATIRVVAAV
ncbi:hypothetical protein CC86DRAFT_153682 [Ophiobolus disseminans]|uniref:Uncharacterized protein n=1 Tax=Ophiobolus disseminans TaxID=1469910 RepID=A0A6A6ZF04_9PLEO|nr:hypothetical protein CC86DRAFT_153682 [Ophiobolus disseminans]